MATLSSRLILSLTNRMGPGANAAVRQMRSIQAAATAANAGVATAGSAMMRGVNQIGAATRRLNASGPGGMGATMAAGAFLMNEVRVQSAMNQTQAILTAGDDAFKTHSDLVVELSKKWPATSAEIAAGASELAMAGMSLEQLNGVLEATVTGSMASGASIKEVGMVVTDVAMAMGKSLTNANFGQINDTLAAGATSYAQDYMQFASGLSKVAPIARITGTSLEELVGLLGSLANAGYKAEKGGTALKTMMINLTAPTAAGMAQLAKYGVKLEEFRGKLDRSLIGGQSGAERLSEMLAEEGIRFDLGAGVLQGILDDESLDSAALRRALTERIAASLESGGTFVDAETLQEAVGGFVASGFKGMDIVGLFKALGEAGAAGDTVALKDIFGKRFAGQGSALSMALFAIDAETGKTAFDQAFDTFTARIPGAVKRFSEMLMKGLPGAVKRLGSAFDGLMRTLANSGAIDTISGLFDDLREVINRLGETSPGVLKALTLGLFGLGALAPIAFALSSVGAALSGLVAVAGLASSVALPVLAAIGAAGLFIANNWEGLGAFFKGFRDGFIDGLGPALPYIEWVAEKLGKIFNWFGKVLGPLESSQAEWRSWGEAVGGFVAWPLNKLGSLFDEIGRIAGIVRNSGIGEAFAYVFGGILSGIKAVVDGLRELIGWLSDLDPFSASGSAIAAGKPAGSVSASPRFSSVIRPDAPGALEKLAALPERSETERELARIGATGGVIVRSLEDAMGAARAIVAGVDLRPEGERIIATMADGIRAAIPQLTEAMQQAASEIRAAAFDASGLGAASGGRGGGALTVNVTVTGGGDESAQRIGRETVRAIGDYYSDGGY